LKKEIRELLKPEILNSVSGLQLIAKVIADGFIHGLNRSYAIGIGDQFSQYRSYEPGDDLRLFDWKVYARSERYYTKLAEVETNIKIKFILDASASMRHKENGMKKLEFAKVIIACMGYITFKQGDEIGVFGLNDKKLHRFPPQIQKHFSRFIYQLIQIESEGKWPGHFIDLSQLHMPAEKELIVVITDFYENENEIFDLIRKIKSTHNEVLVIQVLGRDEKDFNYQGVLTFQDLESSRNLKVNSSNLKEEYLSKMQIYQDELKDRLLNIGVGHETFVMGDPLEDSLSSFLIRRKHLL